MVLASYRPRLAALTYENFPFGLASYTCKKKVLHHIIGPDTGAPQKYSTCESLKVVEINDRLQKIISNFPAGCDTCTYIRIPKKVQTKNVLLGWMQ